MKSRAAPIIPGRFSQGDPVDLRPPPRPVAWKQALVALPVLVFLLAPVVDGRDGGVRTFALVFVSIMLEALPFMLIGSCVGGLIEVFISREHLTEHLPRRPWAVTCLAGALGMVFPVCECAVVPVVRRLARKGLPLSATVAYLLGGPIINPVVGASTALAYALDWRIVALRLGCGYLIAVVVGLLMGRLFAKRPALLESCAALRATKDRPNDETAHHHCECGHDHGDHEHTHDHKERLRVRLVNALRHASDDFLAVAHYLVIGAAVAAFAQTVLVRSIVLEFAELPVLPSAVMMALAILLNLCSEADAFIAASFRGLIPLPGQMAFMLTGPMFDLKLLLMYRTFFTRRAIVFLATAILSAVALVVVTLEVLGGLGV